MSDNGISSVIGVSVRHRRPAFSTAAPEVPAPVHTAEESFEDMEFETAEETETAAPLEAAPAPVEAPVVEEKESRGRGIPESKLSTIKQMVEMGFNAAHVARHTGVSYPTARKYVQELSGSRPAKAKKAVAKAKPANGVAKASAAKPKASAKVAAKAQAKPVAKKPVAAAAPVRRGRPPKASMGHKTMSAPVVERKVETQSAKWSQLDLVVKLVEWSRKENIPLEDMQTALDPAIRLSAAMKK